MAIQVRMSTLLEVKHISVDYVSAKGTVHAVNDVSFAIEPGQIFGLVGESGSGKSTLVYAIARLLQPPAVITQGQVLYYPTMRTGSEISSHAGAVDVLALNPAQLRAFRWRELSIVFQSAMNALNPVLDIGTQITDVLRAHNPRMTRNEARSRALELLQLVGIAPDRLRSYPHELSGGMRQRAIIAIALALNSKLIIMDEPTTALDVVVQRDILAQILRLRNDLGFSVIFITHDLSLLLEIADTIAIMYAGRIVEMGTREELLRTPRHPYTHGLLHSFPKLHGPSRSLKGIPGSPPDLRSIPSGCAFHPRCSFAFPACHSSVPALLPVASKRPKAPALETLSTAHGPCVACHLYDNDLNPGSLPHNLESEHVN
ncbi:MAG TPA: ABC transporter ATP-binding protein [Ktedonobacteraceae bacterium]|nr:ABC transporter ATP-binding protein [Ktedonobacteraceae bacterium]